MTNLLTELGVIVIIATACALVARLLKQPLLLSYILAGILIGPYGLELVTDYSTITVVSELGIAFLLFIVGLELDINKIKNLGAISLIAGIGQVTFTFLAGYFFTQWIGFPPIPSIYISIALTLSSTVLVVKLYEEKNQLDTLHGRIALGILLVQDFLAVLSMAMLSGSADFSTALVATALLKGLGFFIVAMLLGQYLLPALFKFVAESQELLFIASVAWCFLFAIIAEWLELSVAIGAFLAGISLASLPYSFEIINKTKSLRDFFATIFFVALGMQIVFHNILNYLPTIFWLSIFVLIGNPLIVMILMSLFGFKSRTSFLTSIAIAQISEFSLVFVLFAYQNGLVPQFVISVIAVIAVLTFTLSSYMITYGDKLYEKLYPALRLFEKISLRKMEFGYLPAAQKRYDIVICGCDRIGKTVLIKLLHMGKHVLVIDSNPEIIKSLITNHIPCIYGDLTDHTIFTKINLKHAKIVISTIADELVNTALAKKIKQLNKKIIRIVTADHHNPAMHLYNAGVDYVIMPHRIGGHYIASLLQEILKNPNQLKQIRKEHINELLGFENHAG